MEELVVAVAGYGRRNTAVRGVQRRRSAVKCESTWRWT